MSCNGTYPRRSLPDDLAVDIPFPHAGVAVGDARRAEVLADDVSDGEAGEDRGQAVGDGAHEEDDIVLRQVAVAREAADELGQRARVDREVFHRHVVDGVVERKAALERAADAGEGVGVEIRKVDALVLYGSTSGGAGARQGD